MTPMHLKITRDTSIFIKRMLYLWLSYSILPSIMVFAEEPTSKPPHWKKIPVSFAVESNSEVGQSIFKVYIHNRDDFEKTCVEFMHFKYLDRDFHFSKPSFVLNPKAQRIESYPFPSIYLEGFKPNKKGAVEYGLSCVEFNPEDPASREDILNLCNPEQQECNYSCRGESKNRSRCINDHLLIHYRPKHFEPDATAEDFHLTYTINNHTEQKLHCQFLIPVKVKSTVNPHIKSVVFIPSQVYSPISKGVSQISFNFGLEHAGKDFIFLPSNPKLLGTCTTEIKDDFNLIKNCHPYEMPECNWAQAAPN